jgi:hypothetical protein
MNTTSAEQRMVTAVAIAMAKDAPFAETSPASVLVTA